MKTCALYIRVSTDDQTELSPDAQKRLLIDYAKKNDMLVLDEYIFLENGISGRTAEKRPQFQKMIGLCKSKEHPIDAVLVWKFSRFARNQEESIVYKSLLKRNNVEVVSVSEPLPEGMIGSLVERIFEWMDEYYSINLAVEVKRGMTEGAMRGNYQSIPPIGYKYVGQKQPPEVDEAGAEVVHTVFDMFLGGSTFTQIARYLNDLGYRSQRNGKFEVRTVRYILQNPFYIGKVRWNYCDKKTSKLRSNESAEVIIADGKHTPIIDIDTWNKVQEKLGTYIQPYKKRDTSATKHWLSGILVCSDCGRSLALETIKKKDKIYKTYKCWGYTKGMCSSINSITLDNAIASVIDGLEMALESDSNYNVKIIKKSRDESTLENLKKMLSRIESKEAKIKEAYLEGIDTLEEYKTNKLKLTEERNEITAQIDALSKPVTSDQENANEKISKTINNVLAILNNPEVSDIDKGNALRSIVSRIVYSKENNSFDFEFHVCE